MAAQQVPDAERRLYRLWRELPTGPLTERELEDAICAAAGQPGDQAFAKAIVANLCMAAAVRVDGELVNQYAMTLRRDDQGKLFYQRSEAYPVGEDAGYGSDAFNQQLAARAEREKEDLERLEADRQRQRDESPWAIEQRNRAEQVREIIRAEGGALLREAIRAEARAAVLELLSDLDQSTAARLRAQLEARQRTSAAA
jgi:hypothetical protein